MNILCFGDSNTWGYCPISRSKLSPAWPEVLRAKQPDWNVRIDAKPGRTTIFEAPCEQINGWDDYQQALSRADYDHVLIMLGTNDLQGRFDCSAMEAANHLQAFVELAGADKTTLIAPLVIDEIGGFGKMFVGGASKSQLLPKAISTLAAALGTGFIDANDYVQPNKIDGVHWLADDHHRFGTVVNDRLSQIA